MQKVFLRSLIGIALAFGFAGTAMAAAPDDPSGGTASIEKSVNANSMTGSGDTQSTASTDKTMTSKTIADNGSMAPGSTIHKDVGLKTAKKHGVDKSIATNSNPTTGADKATTANSGDNIAIATPISSASASSKEPTTDKSADNGKTTSGNPLNADNGHVTPN